MEILIFGNHNFPDISFELDPCHGFKVMCKNNFVLDYEGLDETVAWKDLVDRTEPSILGHSELITPYPLNHWHQAWRRLNTNLTQVTQSKGERTFLESYFQASEFSLAGKETRSALDISKWPALIPQAWVNWIHYEPKDKERAQRIREEPFRVDFVMFYEGRRLIIEIDGKSHFSEILNIDPNSGQIESEPSLEKYKEHFKRDRWLRRTGWEVWRFSDLETLENDLGIREIFAEMDLHRLFW